MSSNEMRPLAVEDANQRRGRLVVDAPIRMFHVLFALCFLGAFVSGEEESLRALHVVLGYCLIGLLAFRVVYGIVGPPQARLGALWSRLTGLGGSLLRGLTDREQAATLMRQGQNLAMVILVALLMLLAVPLLLSGYGMYQGWPGARLMGKIHEALGNGLFLLALAHMALVLLLSVLRKSNMPWTMVTGRVPGTGPDVVKKSRAWLALIVLLCTAAWGVWQWPQAVRNTGAMQDGRPAMQHRDAATDLREGAHDREHHADREHDQDD